MRQKRIVTIQDLSCFGKCSLGVALPIISAMGIEAVSLPTAVLSTHTGGFKNYTFHDLTNEMPKIASHWEENKIDFDAIYVGYLGSAEQVEIVSSFLDKFASENTTIFIDPVMADEGTLYSGFTDEFVLKIKELCKKADIISPNITESCFLTGKEYRDDNSREYVEEMLGSLKDICGKIILTGVGYDNTQCGAAAYKDGNITPHFKNRIDGHFYGAGDVFASAFIASYVNSEDFEKAVDTATDFVTKSIINTLDERDKYWYGLKFEQCLGSLMNTED